MSQSIRRRDFLRQMALSGPAAAAGMGWLAAPGRSWGAPGSPNEKLNIAVIGTANRAGGQHRGGPGREHRRPLRRGRELPGRGARSGSPGPRPTTISADVSIRRTSTPWSSARPTTPTPRPPSMALKQGKHVYCEKPLTHTVSEARIVRQNRRRRPKVATQMGTQIHAGDNYRRVVELVQSGAIGPVDEVHVWCARRRGPATAGRPRPRPSRATSTGTSGSARRPSGPTTPTYLPKAAGGAGGTSAAARSATWAATTWTCPSGRSACSIPPRSRPRARPSDREVTPTG